MKKCIFFCCGWWPFVCLPLLVLVLAIFISWRDIENDVLNRASKTLIDESTPWASLTTTNGGRNVTVTGAAPSEQARDAALSSLEATTGVRRVIWKGDIAQLAEVPEPITIELKAAALQIKKSANGIIINGTSGNDSVLANEITTADTSQFLVDDGYEKIPKFDELLAFAQKLPNQSIVALDDGTLTLSGIVDALGKKKSLGLQAERLFDGSIVNLLIVELPAVAEEERVTNAECQSLFDQLSDSATVNFVSAQAIVLPESYELLDRFTVLASRCPNATFLVTGHTDNTGSADFNQNISRQRAQAVVNHIVNSGVSIDRFEVSGLGATQPAADNSSAEGRAKNRRVEFTITNQ